MTEWFKHYFMKSPNGDETANNMWTLSEKTCLEKAKQHLGTSNENTERIILVE